MKSEPLLLNLLNLPLFDVLNGYNWYYSRDLSAVSTVAINPKITTGRLVNKKEVSLFKPITRDIVRNCCIVIMRNELKYV